jgi:hypothetical protein
MIDSIGSYLVGSNTGRVKMLFMSFDHLPAGDGPDRTVRTEEPEDLPSCTVKPTSLAAVTPPKVLVEVVSPNSVHSRSTDCIIFQDEKSLDNHALSSRAGSKK